MSCISPWQQVLRGEAALAIAAPVLFPCQALLSPWGAVGEMHHGKGCLPTSWLMGLGTPDLLFSACCLL